MSIPESSFLDIGLLTVGGEANIQVTGRTTEIDHESMQSHYFMNTNANPRALVTSQLTREGDPANVEQPSTGEQRKLRSHPRKVIVSL